MRKQITLLTSMVILNTYMAGENPFLAVRVDLPIPHGQQHINHERVGKGVMIETKVVDNVTLLLQYMDLFENFDISNETYAVVAAKHDSVLTHQDFFCCHAAVTYYQRSVFSGLYGRLGVGYYSKDLTFMSGNLSESVDAVTQNYKPYLTTGYNMTFMDCIIVGGGLGVSYDELSYTMDDSNSKTKQQIADVLDATGGFSVTGDLNVAFYI